jgi:glucuronate isomerase
VRAIAEDLYASVAALPIISPHGHVDPRLLVENKPFANPAELFIFFDHYVTRLLHAEGFDLASFGKGEAGANADPRHAWNILCSNWHLLLGTSSGYWLNHEFSTLFGINEAPSAENSERLYDLISSELLEPRMLPRALFESFNIEFLATTDDPCDDLAGHKSLAADPSFKGRVAPTFRPDAYLDPRTKGWLANVDRLLAVAGETEPTYASFIRALENRRAYFKANGAVSCDHGVLEAYTTILSEAKASELFDGALSGKLSEGDKREFAGHMLAEMARMSTEDGLVMTIHAGVVRNHSTAIFNEFGPDTGHDIPVAAEFTQNLRPMLEVFGLHPNLTVILFSLDETTWSREVAPLAGFYPSVRVGAPWWFLDAPDSATRFREATTEIAGFYRGSGFIDDTRAFLSIPARHDMARRVDCAFLARLVNEGRLTLEQAQKVAVDLVVEIPRKAFKL